MNRWTGRVALSTFVLLVLALAVSEGGGKQDYTKNKNVRLGIPGGIRKPNPKHTDDFLIYREEYVLSYNNSNRTPNWVVWQLKTTG